jgi:hypothetical protein
MTDKPRGAGAAKKRKKTPKKEPKKTDRQILLQRQREWRSKERACLHTIKVQSGEILRLQEKLAKYKAEERWRKREEEINWETYDRAVDATTQAERDLFVASPAYKKYQRAREARAEQEPWSEGDKKRRMLNTGNWRAP